VPVVAAAQRNSVQSPDDDNYVMEMVLPHEMRGVESGKARSVADMTTKSSFNVHRNTACIYGYFAQPQPMLHASAAFVVTAFAVFTNTPPRRGLKTGSDTTPLPFPAAKTSHKDLSTSTRRCIALLAGEKNFQQGWSSKPV
jgi:hypothetical protein